MKTKAPKVTVDGATWKRFYSDPKLWEPAGECYHEDEEFWVDGDVFGPDDEKDMDNVPDTAKVAVVAGTYYDVDQDSHDFVSVFRQWVKEDKKTSVEMALVPKARLEALEKCYQTLSDMVESQYVDEDAALEAVEAVRATEGKK